MIVHIFPEGPTFGREPDMAYPTTDISPGFSWCYDRTMTGQFSVFSRFSNSYTL